jgi:hypothetical protein
MASVYIEVPVTLATQVVAGKTLSVATCDWNPKIQAAVAGFSTPKAAGMVQDMLQAEIERYVKSLKLKTVKKKSNKKGASG